MNDLREWLVSKIDGSEETRGEDSLISGFIAEIDALPTTPMTDDQMLGDLLAIIHRDGGHYRAQHGTQVAVADAHKIWGELLQQLDVALFDLQAAESRGCPTPGACSAVDELADLKQRLLPQFQGRTQRAEHERDALLEQLIEARSAMQQSYGCLWRYTGSSNPMLLQARKGLLARLTKEQQAIGIRYANEVFGHTTEHEILHSDCSHDAAPSATAATVDHSYVRSASLNEGRYVCACAICSRPDAGGKP